MSGVAGAVHIHEEHHDPVGSRMGMWLFLITEILLFSGMFVAYTVYRVWHPEVFEMSAELLDWSLGCLNTIVLLASSFTVAVIW